MTTGKSIKSQHRGRRIGKAVMAVCVGVIVALLLGEALAVCYVLIKEGKFVRPGDRLTAQKNAYVENMRSKECTYQDSVLVHPFLANVHTNRGPCGSSMFNSKGMTGREYPDRPRPKIGYVLVTGGSVADQFTWGNPEKPSHLERILNEQFTGGTFERFVVLNGGGGGWKQPNQYILFGLYADVLAGVIALDGFNEHYTIGSKQRFERPSDNFFHVVRQLDARGFMLSDAALRLEASIYRFALNHGVFHVSTFAYLLEEGIRGWLRTYGAGARNRTAHRNDDWVNASYETMFLFTDDMSKREKEKWAIEQYAKYIRLMHGGAKELGIPSLFLIQPTPAFDKALTETERPFGLMTRKAEYTQMVDSLLRLKAQHGIPVFSLLDTFKLTTEQIYQDHIHVNDLGNRLLAERVADLIEHVWSWPRHVPHREIAAGGAHPVQ